MSEPTYQEWCARYGYHPDSAAARKAWRESREALAALRAAAGKAKES